MGRCAAYVFLSSITSDGDLGGLAGADNCNDWSSTAGFGTNGNNLTTNATWSLISGTVSTCDNGGSKLFCLQQ